MWTISYNDVGYIFTRCQVDVGGDVVQTTSGTMLGYKRFENDVGFIQIDVGDDVALNDVR